MFRRVDVRMITETNEKISIGNHVWRQFGVHCPAERTENKTKQKKARKKTHKSNVTPKWALYRLLNGCEMVMRKTLWTAIVEKSVNHLKRMSAFRDTNKLSQSFTKSQSIGFSSSWNVACRTHNSNHLTEGNSLLSLGRRVWWDIKAMA